MYEALVAKLKGKGKARTRSAYVEDAEDEVIEEGSVASIKEKEFVSILFLLLGLLIGNL